MKQETLFPMVKVNPKDIWMTPDNIAKEIVDMFHPKGKCLDPCKGNGAFLKYLPEHSDWCEIREGRDFFQYSEKVDFIVSNPPFSVFYEWLLHSFQVSDNVIYLIPLHKLFNSMKNLNAIHSYGGIYSIYVIGQGNLIGFPLGFATGAVYFKRGYSGKTEWIFRHNNANAAEQTPPRQGAWLN